MPTTIEYANNPNEETAFVTPEGGQRTRAVLTTTVDGTVKFPDNPNSTKVSVTIDGVARKAVAVYNVAGGGDQHNLGYYATQAALEEAHATAEAGDWAIVGATDTVWIWDDDSSAWVDSDQKGQVTSVNNKTGAVTLAAADVDAVPQYDTMPTASASNWPSLVQYSGATDSTYTKGYFYENVKTAAYTGSVTFSPASVSQAVVACSDSDFVAFLQAKTSAPELVTNGTISAQILAGTTYYNIVLRDASNNILFQRVDSPSYFTAAGFTFTPALSNGDVVDITCSVTDSSTYAWAQIDVQPQAGGLPTQTGNSGKFLTTDGTDASWAAISALQNTATVSSSLTILGTAATNVNSINIGSNSNTNGKNNCVLVGFNTSASKTGTVAIGSYASATQDGCIALGTDAIAKGSAGIKIGAGTSTGSSAIAIGSYAQANATRAIQLGYGTNTTANTFSIGNANGNYEMMSADGTIPTARFTTDPVSDGTYVPTLTIASGVATRSWSAPSGGLPSQTGNSGKFLTTDGTDASWSDKPLVNNLATGITNTINVDLGHNQAQSNNSTAIGAWAKAQGNDAAAFGKSSTAKQNSVAIGSSALVENNGVAIGYKAWVYNDNAIQINASGNSATNSDKNTFKVANQNGNFEIMDANGNLPAARLASTTGLADGNYRLRLTMASGVPTLSWVAE